jgi:hypothetical protein
MVMAIDLAKVTSAREEVDEFVTERDVVRERAATARKAKVAWETSIAAAEQVAPLVPEEITPPEFPSDEYLAFLDEAAKGVAAKPSDEITKLVGKLTNWVAVAEDLDIPDDEALKIKLTLSRFGAAEPKNGTRTRAAAGESSPSARARDLRSHMRIVISDPLGAEVKRVNSGTQSDGADWGTAQDQINVAFKTLDPQGYAQIKPELRVVRDQLLAVDDGELGSVDEMVTSPLGYTVHIEYPV